MSDQIVRLHTQLMDMSIELRDNSDQIHIVVYHKRYPVHDTLPCIDYDNYTIDIWSKEIKVYENGMFKNGYYKGKSDTKIYDKLVIKVLREYIEQMCTRLYI